MNDLRDRHPEGTVHPPLTKLEPRATQEPVVEVQHLTKVYEPSALWMRFLLRSAIDQPVRALDDVSLSVRPGEVCAVVGPNGAGKSTLFRILTGLTTATSGSATIMGSDIEREPRRVRKLVGFMPSDDRSLYLRHTCEQNLAFHGRLQGLSGSRLKAVVGETLELVGLGGTSTRTGFALSAGMRARLQLARALLHRPKVLILDEPTANVDPVGSYLLLGLIERLTKEQGLAVLLSSHRLEEIDALHDNVAFLDRGVLVHWGDLHSLRDVWEHPRVVVRFDAADSARAAAGQLASAPGVDVVAVDAESVTAVVAGTTGDLLVSLDGHLARVASIEEARMPLRELLTRLVELPRE
jgi:ABC-2 type transport system ATP-binding protein